MLRDIVRLPLFLALGITTANVLAAPRPPAPHNKIAPDALTGSGSETIPVIIQDRSEPATEHISRVDAVGGKVAKQLHSVHGLVAHVPQSMLERLASDPNVLYVSPDRPVSVRDTVSITAPDYFLEPINAPQVWASGYIGTNIGIAVIDSGIQPVEDLKTTDPNTLPPGQPTPVKYQNV